MRGLTVSEVWVDRGLFRGVPFSRLSGEEGALR